MSKKKKKGKGINYTSMKCPYCGATVTYKSADEMRYIKITAKE